MSEYIRRTWKDGEVIDAPKLNNIETGIGEAMKAAESAKTYTDEQIQKIPEPDVGPKINAHNVDTGAHADIRQAAANAASAAATAQRTADSKAPMYTYGTTDITAGSASTEPEGSLHFVIE